MLQAAFGGYYLADPQRLVRDDVLSYYEPGYDLMTPLELVVSQGDQLYILLRKRLDSSGDTFENSVSSNFTFTVTDVTTGLSIPSWLYGRNDSLYDTYFYSSWKEEVSGSETVYPLELVINNTINVNNIGALGNQLPIRTRILDCYIKDKRDDDFIRFRIIIEDGNKIFNYIVVNSSNMLNRFTFSANGYSGVATIASVGDTYVLISPMAFLTEVTSTDDYDFSYPLDTIYYKRQKTYNNEDFDFSIYNYTHDFIGDNIQLVNVPGYKKAAALLIDRHLHTDMLTTSDITSVNIRIFGSLSEINETFKLYLRR